MRRLILQNAGGVPESSRGLSESASDTPGCRMQNVMHPGGVPERLTSTSQVSPLIFNLVFGQQGVGFFLKRVPPVMRAMASSLGGVAAAATTSRTCCRTKSAVIHSAMSLFKINVTARNPKHEELVTQPLPALVDTGSELTWIPAEVLKGVGITPRRKRIFAT